MSWTLNDSVYWWKNCGNFEHLVSSKERFKSAKEAYLKALNGEYIDVHFSVFTPESFLMLLYNMVNFNLLPFKCVKFYNTEPNSNEFNCVLEFDPNMLIENSHENETEKINLMRLLVDNSDIIIYQKKYNKNIIKIFLSIVKKAVKTILFYKYLKRK